MEPDCIKCGTADGVQEMAPGIYFCQDCYHSYGPACTTCKDRREVMPPGEKDPRNVEPCPDCGDPWAWESFEGP